MRVTLKFRHAGDAWAPAQEITVICSRADVARTIELHTRNGWVQA